MRGTFRRIEIVVFGSANNHICCLDFEASNAAEKIASLEAEKADLLEKVAYLLKDNERKSKMIDMFIEQKTEERKDKNVL